MKVTFDRSGPDGNLALGLMPQDLNEDLLLRMFVEQHLDRHLEFKNEGSGAAYLRAAPPDAKEEPKPAPEPEELVRQYVVEARVNAEGKPFLHAAMDGDVIVPNDPAKIVLNLMTVGGPVEKILQTVVPAEPEKPKNQPHDADDMLRQAIKTAREGRNALVLANDSVRAHWLWNRTKALDPQWISALPVGREFELDYSVPGRLGVYGCITFSTLSSLSPGNPVVFVDDRSLPQETSEDVQAGPYGRALKALVDYGLATGLTVWLLYDPKPQKEGCRPWMARAGVYEAYGQTPKEAVNSLFSNAKESERWKV